MYKTFVEHSTHTAFAVCLMLSGLLAFAAFPRDARAEDDIARLFEPADVHRILTVDDISISPDGDWIAYEVGSTDVEHDEQSTDLFMVSWDGSRRVQLTHTPRESESQARFSPDGRYIAFLAARGGDGSDDSEDPRYLAQVWLLDRAGGEATRLTEMPGGVSSFDWSPDSKRLVLTSRDPEQPRADSSEDATHDTPPPIVVDRYLFKSDGRDWLDDRRTRIYVFDIATKAATLLTPGPYDSDDPTWSPAGNLIAFTSKRGDDPDRHQNSDIYVVAPEAGATPRQLTAWRPGPVHLLRSRRHCDSAGFGR